MSQRSVVANVFQATGLRVARVLIDGNQTSLAVSPHSFTRSSAYSSRPKSAVALFVPNVNLMPRAFAILTMRALGIL